MSDAPDRRATRGAADCGLPDLVSRTTVLEPPGTAAAQPWTPDAAAVQAALARVDSPPRSAVSMTEVTKVYPNGKHAIEDIDLEVPEGDFVFLVGPSGAGKSTLIKILLGLLEPTSGSAQVMDLDVRTRGQDIGRLVGYMPEHDCLPPDLTATDLVSYLGQMSGLPRGAARDLDCGAGSGRCPREITRAGGGFLA